MVPVSPDDWCYTSLISYLVSGVTVVRLLNFSPDELSYSSPEVQSLADLCFQSAGHGNVLVISLLIHLADPLSMNSISADAGAASKYLTVFSFSRLWSSV